MNRAEQEYEAEWEAAVQAEAAGTNWSLREWYAAAERQAGAA